MSDTRTIGAAVVSVIALATFTGALIVSFVVGEAGLLNLAVGAAIANATTVVQYWLGSSSGSGKKDDTISDIAQKAQQPGSKP